MKIHAFQVRIGGVRSVADLVQRISERPLEDREFPGASSGMRLEESNIAGQLVFLDFARPRAGHGPGRMGRNQPLEDIPLGENNVFGEDTAMAYDAATGFAAVQFNPFGPRPSAIQEYLTAADLAFGVGADGRYGIVLAPRFRMEAFRRLREYRIVKEIDFTISVPGVSRHDFDAGRSVGSILRTPLPGGVQTVSVKLTAGRRRGDSLAVEAAFAVLTDLERLGGDLVSGSVKGKRDQGDRTSKVDLVDERLTSEREIRPGRGHRYARPERWMALRDALLEWRDGGQLQ